MSILAEMGSSQINDHWSVLMRATALILTGFTSLQDRNKKIIWESKLFVDGAETCWFIFLGKS